MDNKKLGQAGERLAVNFLEARGYTIIGQNFRTRFGEIDIIARDGKALVFIEVKTRSNMKYGTPAEAITKDKLRRIQRLIGDFVSKYQIRSQVRFEVVAIVKGQVPQLIKEIEFVDK